jgi:transcriptional regulator with XRE-family HTH domain
MSTTEQVLSDFVDAWNAGRRPRVREYLARVPEGPIRDDLADQISTWLEVAPAPRYSSATRAQIRAEPIVQSVFGAVGDDAGLWPSVIPQLRARAGLSVGDLAARLVDRLGLGSGSRERTADYLERMERGELEASRVSRRLLDALGDLLGASGRALADAGMLGTGPRLASPGGTLFRAERDAGDWVAHDIETLSRAGLTPAPAEMDELDRLFMGGADA